MYKYSSLEGIMVFALDKSGRLFNRPYSKSVAEGQAGKISLILVSNRKSLAATADPRVMFQNRFRL